MNTVAKIIFDKLASGGGIFLPEIGALYVERDAAKFISGKEIRPPHNRVVFSRRENPALESVVDIITRGEGMDREAASKRYAQWLAAVKRSDGLVEIHGVGVIKNNFFYPSVELHDRLNPLGQKNLTVKKHRGNNRTVLFVGIGVVALAAIVFIIVALSNMNGGGRRGEPVVAEGTYNGSERDQVRALARERSSRRGNNRQSTEIINESEPEVVQQTVVTPEPALPTYHLVAGVFDTLTNAQKCVNQDPLRIGSDKYNIYPYTRNRYMVSAYESTVKSDVDARQRELKFRKSDIWVYTMR